MYENPDNDGNSPLHLACLAKDLKLAQIILGMECDVNITNSNGDTPLHIACKNGGVDIIELLLDMKCKCNPDIINSSGDTPLHIACRNGNFGISKLLLDMNCNVNIEDQTGDTALSIVCRGKNYLLLRLFQKKQARSTSGESPFFLACKFGNSELITLLLKLNWDSTELNNDGIAPIQVAFSNGNCKPYYCKLQCTKLYS